jgi:Domain of unknown function DUF29
MVRNVVRKEHGAPTKRDDLYLWAVRQADLLRAGRLSEIDPVAIAEEIDDVGEEEYHRLESVLRVGVAASPKMGSSARQAQLFMGSFNRRTSEGGPSAASEKSGSEIATR